MDFIRIRRTALTALQRHARAALPQECCGALLGPEAGAERTVLRAVGMENECPREPERRYCISAAAVRRTELEAERQGLAVLGFYHSHPAAIAAPSTLDRDQAWPWYAYLIIPVSAGIAGEPRAWRLDADRARFRELRVLVEEEMA